MNAPIADARNPDVVDAGRPELHRILMAFLHKGVDSLAFDAAAKVLRVLATMSVFSMF